MVHLTHNRGTHIIASLPIEAFQITELQFRVFQIAQMLSALQKVTHEVISYDSDSDHKVDTNKYFVVKIELSNAEADITEFIKKDVIAKHIMNTSVVCAYVYRNVGYVLYSSVEEYSHYLGGSHHEICSHYASNASLFFGFHTRCNITEFTSRTKVLIYFQAKMYENMKASIHSLSKISISKKETSNLTQKELIDALESRTSIKWESASPGQRFGTFYRYYVSADGTRKFSTLSELITPENMDKYNSYLFG